MPLYVFHQLTGDVAGELAGGHQVAAPPALVDQPAGSVQVRMPAAFPALRAPHRFERVRRNVSLRDRVQVQVLGAIPAGHDHRFGGGPREQWRNLIGDLPDVVPLLRA